MSKRKMRAVVRVVIYTRISEGLEDGETPESDRQEYEIREALDDAYGTEGYEVVGQHYDAESAWKKVRGADGEFHMRPRPGFDATLALASARQVDVVATWSSDRLCRTVKVVTQIIDSLGTDPDDGVGWLTVVDDRIDLTTASGRKKAHALAADAEFESSRKSERVKAANRYAARQGWAPAKACFGFTREDWGPKKGATFHQVPDEVITVRTMADAVLCPDGPPPTLRQIAEQLNDAGLFRRGVRWSSDGVFKLLRSPSIAGLVKDPANPGEFLPGNWKEIVTVEEWEDIGHVLADPSRRTRRKPGAYWLRGCLFDVYGIEMSGCRCDRKVGRGLPLVRDRRGYQSNPRKATRLFTIDADAVETFLMTAVGMALPTLAAIEEAEGGPLMLSPAETAAAALEAELHELSAMKGRGELSMGEWKAQRRELMPRVEEAQREARSARLARRRPAMRLHDMVERWARPASEGGLTLNQRRDLVRSVVGRVTVRPAREVGQARADMATIAARLVFPSDSPMAEALARG